MATYTIVDKAPLDPGEINAGDTINVSDGDIFIIDPTVGDAVVFDAAGGVPAGFDIQISARDTNGFKLDIGDDLSPSLTVADSVDISDVEIDASSSNGVTLIVGDNVSMGKFTGSDLSADIIDVGDGFTTTQTWDAKGGDNDLTYGDDATVHDIDTGADDDTVRIGDNAIIHNLKTDDGNNTIYMGANAAVASINAGGDTDTLNAQTTGLSVSYVEQTNIVCFAGGTLIDTIAGQIGVDDLSVGGMVQTADHGYQPLRWIGTMRLSAEVLRRAARLRPICIAVGALGCDMPSRDLRVSPQHRILVRSAIALRMFGSAEIFIVAKRLTPRGGGRAGRGRWRRLFPPAF